MNKKLYLMVAISIGASLFISSFLNNEIFIAGTPKIRPNIDKYLMARAKTLLFEKNLIAQFLHRSKKTVAPDVASIYKKAEDTPFTPIAPGVYAKSGNDVVITEYRKDEIEWIIYTYVVNGKIVKIKVPKGISPPPKEMIK